MDEETLKQVARQLRKPEGEQGIQVGNKMNEGNLHINMFAIEAMDLQPDDSILEIGMGNGFFVKDILSIHPSLHYSGCDFSSVMIEQARLHNQKFIDEGRAAFHLAAAKKLPFEDDRFEKILTVNTLYFWEDEAQILKEVRRVLKEHGLLVLGIRPKSVMENFPFVQYGFRMFSDSDVTHMLEKNGFKVNDVSVRDEPDQDIAGRKFRFQSLIVSARKVS